MADVSRIQGPSGPPESSKPGRAVRKDGSGSFKDEMRRVDEVEKIDPDEAGKRKRPEEAIREEALTRKEKKTGISEGKQSAGIDHMIKSRKAEVAAGSTMPASPETSEEEKKKAAAKGTEVTAVTKPESITEVKTPILEEPTPEEALLFHEEPPPRYTHLHPDVMDIFERMVGALIMLDQSGIKETKITITSSEEKPSVFNGAEITIREYSTAPKQFNVELKGAPKAVELFQANKQDLMDAFDAMPYTFKVNNIETSLQ